ncbi:MAG: hypothetical protein ACJARE_001163 [Paracoccaceae bacterium]|jgi:uncharacterized protein (TIGR00255 family)
MTIRSMTGFAAREGSHGTLTWRWEMRAVNARGLDLRWRGPEGRDALEPAIRKNAQARLTRGAVSIALRIDDGPDAAGPRLLLDPVLLNALLDADAGIRAAAAGRGITCAPLSAEALLSHRGVLDRAPDIPDPDLRAAQDAAILADGLAALEGLVAMRAEEGARLAAIIAGQIDDIEGWTARAAVAAAARAAAQGPLLRRRLAAVLDAAGGAVDAARLAQELALIAVKGDVSEEIDRLGAHIAAARDLMGRTDAVGRRLDFLTQEFNREANTLCAKADFAALTEAGLELKTVIDRMREQVQNIE